MPQVLNARRVTHKENCILVSAALSPKQCRQGLKTVENTVEGHVSVVVLQDNKQPNINNLILLTSRIHARQHY